MQSSSPAILLFNPLATSHAYTQDSAREERSLAILGFANASVAKPRIYIYF